MQIVIVDYGSGNIASVENMVRRQGGIAKRSSRPEDVQVAAKLILPGVGAFDHGIRQLKNLGLFTAVQEQVTAGTPILGICAGMQLLGNGSEEGQLEGLKLVDAEFRRFVFDVNSNLRIPHVGWNQVHVERQNALIPLGVDEQRFYFTHSYHAICSRPEDVLATADYGYPFTAAYNCGQVYGVQFHPEKSHRFGMTLIKNFLDL